MLLLLRGAIVSAYGYLEAALSELAIRLSEDEKYLSLRSTYPYKMSSRLSFLRAAFAIEPLDRYRNIAELFFSRLEAAAELRHIMAHAKAEVPGRALGVRFIDYKPGPNGTILQRRHQLSYAAIEKAAKRAIILTHVGQRLYCKLERDGFLPTK